MLSKRWIFALIVVSVGVFVHKRLSYSPVYKIEKRLESKVVVITGGNSGIGKAAAIEFAKLGAKVIIASRNLQNTQWAKDEIAKESGNQNVEGYQLDLESFDSVQQFAKKINEQEEFIDFLVNNAGVATVRGLTPQGLSRIFAINHLGHFLLTNMLLEKMLKQSKNNRPVRIINVSSAAYRIKKTIDFDSMLHYNSSSVIEDFTNYGQSKLANVLFTSELDRRYKDAGITSYVLHPGLVSTNIGNDFPDWFKAMTTILMSMYARTSFLGCQTIMYCALDAHVTEYSGSYFEDNAYSPLDKFAKDEKAAIELWNISLNLTGLS